MNTDTLLVTGHITKDVFPDRPPRLGGAVTYAAQAARALGWRTTVLTSAPEEHPLLNTLKGDKGIIIDVYPSDDITTFELCEDTAGRRLLCHALADPLPPASADRFSGMHAAYVCPVANECSLAFCERVSAPVKVLGAQGLLRKVAVGKSVTPLQSPTLPRGFDTIIFSEEDHPQARAMAQELAIDGTAAIVTAGARGLTLYEPGRASLDIQASQAPEVDSLGAGDVFGCAFTIARAQDVPQRVTREQACTFAAECAARSVTGEGIGELKRTAPSLIL